MQQVDAILEFLWSFFALGENVWWVSENSNGNESV